MEPLETLDADTGKIDTPIGMKAGIALLEKMNLVEWAVQAAMTGDNGPLTSSPTQRRNLALVLAECAAEFTALAERIDPLAEAEIRWQATDPVDAPVTEEAPRFFTLQPTAFAEALERVEKDFASFRADYLTES